MTDQDVVPTVPSPPAPAYDQALKRLLTDAHDGVLALLFPQARWLGERSPELPAHRRQADLVWDVTDSFGERVLLHIELQADADREIGERVAEYAIRLWRREHLPVRSVVVALRDGGAPMDGPFTMGRGEREPGLHYPFDTVRLWRIEASRVLAAPDARLWPLAALMAGPAAEVTRAAALQISAADLPRGERSELAGLLAVLAGLRLSRAMVERLVRSDPVIHDIFAASSFAQLMREEGEAKGREEGEAKGREEGEAKGRQEGEAKGRQDALRAVAHDLLASRFGAVSADELAALHQADEATLRVLATHVVTDSRPQLRVWLGLPAEPAN